MAILGLDFQDLSPPLVQGLVQLSFQLPGFLAPQGFLHPEKKAALIRTDATGTNEMK